MVLPPNVTKEKYTRTKHGIMGSLGAGETRINFIQSTFSVSDLDELGLVCEIPGSEQWPVRQLFQRDIDVERVTSEIIPYFKKSSKARFFNPLTIAVLPIDQNGALNSSLREKDEEPSPDFSDGKSYAIDSLYKVSYMGDDPAWAEIKWNPSKVRLIAIDGQHRLSALKRIKQEMEQNPTEEDVVNIDFSSWTIPVIVITVGHSEKIDNSYKLINKARDIFVTINKQAKSPSRCRTILLNDYSVTSICTQELLDSCRSNTELPLALFDWRDHKDADRPELSSTLARVDEIEDWLIHYFIGEDDGGSGHITLQDCQKEGLFVNDMNPPLDASSDIALRKGIQLRFKETLFPAIMHILINCKPYSDYVEYLRSTIANDDDDIGKHAWSRLIYGSDYSPSSIERQVSDKKNNILAECNERKQKLGREYNNLIGLRGVFSGFSIFAKLYREGMEIQSWEELAKQYVKGFNEAYSTEYLNSGSELFRHLTIDHNESIVNYKLQDVSKSFGLLCCYAVVCKLGLKEKLNHDWLEEALRRSLLRGYKKEVRPQIKEDNLGRSKEDIDNMVNKKADKKTTVQMKKIGSAFL